MEFFTEDGNIDSCSKDAHNLDAGPTNANSHLN